VNFLVAAALLICFFHLTVRRRLLVVSLVVCALGLGALAIYAQPIVTFGEQSSYRDKVIFAEQTRYQKIVITRWRDDYWLFINGKEQFSTMDEHLYHEPLVHPAMMLSADPGRVLILGGGDGLALREVLKHRRVRSVTLVDLDPAMTRLAAEHPVLTRVNRGSMRDERVRVLNQDARAFLREDRNLYGVIIVDLPDPASFELMHLYSLGFYRLAASHLQAGGVLVTQAGSPYFANRAFLCILKTMGAAGFSTLAYHNDIPTMGQWGWVLGVRASEMDPAELKKRAASLDLDRAPNRFLNREAMISMIHFGKGVLDPARLAEVEVNTEFKPVLQRYYAQGLWDAY
jgi:spermidine synthase